MIVARSAFPDSEKARLQVTLDRQQYLAGEAIRGTRAMFNPTREPLLVLDPFDSRAGCLDLKRLDMDVPRFWHPWNEPPKCPGGLAGAPTMTLAVGQKIEHAIPSAFAGPYSAGSYRLAFCFHHSQASCVHVDFTVADPVFRGLAVVQLMPREGATHRGYVHAYLLEWGRKRYIGVTGSGEGTDVDAPLDQPLSGRYRIGLGLYDRVAEATLDAQNLQIAADADENLIVTWTEGSRTTSVCVTKDRTHIKACSPGR